jgi:hypothetical protein
MIMGEAILRITVTTLAPGLVVALVAAFLNSQGGKGLLGVLLRHKEIAVFLIVFLIALMPIVFSLSEHTLAFPRILAIYVSELLLSITVVVSFIFTWKMLEVIEQLCSEPYLSTIKVLRLLQKPWVRWHLFLSPLTSWVFGLRQVSFRVVECSNDRGKTSAAAFQELAKVIVSAKKIQMALGEIGHELMERPELLESLLATHANNGATVEIVHGPRVDPETEKVFTLARQGVLSLYQMPNYKSHHYIIVTQTTGEKIVIEEGIHCETIWREDQLGKINTDFTSGVRLYYVIRNSKRLAALRENEFEKRKRVSTRTEEHPYISAPQNRSPLRLFVETVIDTSLKQFCQSVVIWVLAKDGRRH